MVIVETVKAEMFGNQHSQLLLELLEGVRDEWLRILEKVTSTPAYHKMKQEAGNIGDALVQEITKTANNGNTGVDHLVVCSSIDLAENCAAGFQRKWRFLNRSGNFWVTSEVDVFESAIALFVMATSLKNKSVQSVVENQFRI